MTNAIRIQNLSKRYRLGASGGLGSMVRSLRRGTEPKELWALRDVSFDVAPGEAIGIIGHNGAGKSTLLKVLSRITEPTHGRVELRGRVASLLEVGTGFHPELSGRENIYLNGAILGMARREIAARFDEIVDFSGVEKFLETPVKRYSSGMRVRLAFAVAAHLEPEILIVDEVLTVGDAAFQAKCMGKMQGLTRGSGRTVLFVSHNIEAVLGLCDSGVLLRRGKCNGKTTAEQAVREYLGDGGEGTAPVPLAERDRYQAVDRAPIFRRMTLFSGDVETQQVRVGEAVRFEIEMHDFSDLTNAECGIVITNDRMQRVVAFHNLYHAGLNLPGSPRTKLVCDVPHLPLVPGRYHVNLVCADRSTVVERVDRAASFDVLFADVLGTGKLPNGQHGPLVLPSHWRIAC